jgi:hypothetical protein
MTDIPKITDIPLITDIPKMAQIPKMTKNNIPKPIYPKFPKYGEDNLYLEPL